MKKYFIIPLIALLFIGLVFSGGCLTKSEAKEAPKKMFIGGSNGLELSFLPGVPQSEIFENTEFTIGVQLENKGEYTVPAGVQVKIGGIPVGSDGFNIDPSFQSTDAELSAASLIADEAIPGGLKVFNFPAKSPEYPGDTEVTIIASTCYPYQSLAVATVCLKDDLFMQTTGAPEICTVSGEKTVYNRASPIQVTSIKEVPMGPNKLGFQIKLKNSGDGQVYLPGQGCTGSGINKLTVESVKIRGITFDCPLGSQLTLVDGEAFIFCDKELPADTGEYEDILEVTLSYNYLEQASKKVKILNVPGGSGSTTTSDEGTGSDQGAGAG